MEEEKKDNVAVETEEEATAQGAKAQQNEGATGPFGKFKTADALLKAYDSLQAEFTRRSQRLKELEKSQEGNKNADFTVPEESVSSSRPAAPLYNEINADGVYQLASADEGVKNRIIADYLASVGKGVVPLVSSGAGVITPSDKPKNLSEAGALALGYFKGTGR